MTIIHGKYFSKASGIFVLNRDHPEKEGRERGREGWRKGKREGEGGREGGKEGKKEGDRF